MARMIESKIRPDVVWKMHHNGYSATIGGKSVNISETFSDDKELCYSLNNEGRVLFGWKPIDRVEFEVGQEVTFHPYLENDPVPAIVAEVAVEGVTFKEPQNAIRIFYRLKGRHISNPLKSICTGKSIVESIYYSPVHVADAFKD